MSTIALEWRAIPGLPDYEVSRCGDVRRAGHCDVQPGRRLRGIIDADGYVQFDLRLPTGERAHRYAHQLVALAFLGPPPSSRHQVAHNNGSRLLNVPENLRWASCMENQHDRFVHETSATGQRNPRAKISDDDVRYIRRRYRELKLARLSPSELDRQFGLTRSQVIRIARGQAWSHVQ